MMSSRIRTMIVSAGVACLGVLLPTAGLAVEVSPSAPDGEALVRVDGGTAYAKKLKNAGYRIVMPQRASIVWLGGIGGRTATGAFTPKALVAGWAKMGHGDGKTAITTILWSESGVVSSALVKVGKPRINSAGQVTFRVNPRGYTLPAQMRDFSLNVSWADPSPVTSRDYPISFKTFGVDPPSWGTAFVSAAVQNYASATVTFKNYTGLMCASIGIPLAQKYTIQIPTTTCGNGRIDNKYNYGKSVSQVLYSQSTPTSRGSIVLNFGYTPTGGTQFPWAGTIAEWDDDGNNTLP